MSGVDCGSWPRCDLERLLPHLAEVIIDRIHEADGRVVIEARSGRDQVACPGCGIESARVHASDDQAQLTYVLASCPSCRPSPATSATSPT
jgi:hypothetical protein